MTDKSGAEKRGLTIVFPGVPQLLCHFHVGQAEWEWLLKGRNGIAAEDRKPLMQAHRQVRTTIS